MAVRATRPIRSGRPIMSWDPAAVYLDTSVRHLQYLVTTKRIPFLKVGGLIRFDPDQLDRWITERSVG